MPTYDVAVVGLGGVGSAALYHLAKQDLSVIGLDRFTPPHDRGSSHGDTRVIRLAYFEHPNYVPLLKRAFENWEQLEQASGRQLLFKVGLLQIGRQHGEIIQGILKSAAQHNLPIEEFTFAELTQHFPGIVPPAHCVGVLERQAGYLLVEACIETHLQLARTSGAEVCCDSPVMSWQPRGASFALQLADEVIEAHQVVVCGGAWSSGILEDLRIPLSVVRKHLYWYSSSNPRYTKDAGFPTYLFETEQGIFYGFPAKDQFGVKVSRHDGGQELRDPDKLQRSQDPQDRHDVECFLNDHLPDVGPPLLRHEVCMYTMTPDGHFVVDSHPAHPRLHFAAGLSGHGFKFASALGEILAQKVIGTAPTELIEFLSVSRFD